MDLFALLVFNGDIQVLRNPRADGNAIIDNLWDVLKRAVHPQPPSNPMELERFWKEHWSNTPSRRIQTHSTGYTKSLEAAIFAKGGSAKF